MTNNHDAPAFPVPVACSPAGDLLPAYDWGLTKRELLASNAYQQCLEASCEVTKSKVATDNTLECMGDIIRRAACWAVWSADALLDELAKTAALKEENNAL
jgi:hypothetical protein